MLIRQSDSYGKVFDILPVLGGSLPYIVLTISFVCIYKSEGNYLTKLGFYWSKYGKTVFRSLLLTAFWAFIILFVSLVCGAIIVEAFDLVVGPATAVSARKSPLEGHLTLLLILAPLMWCSSG